MTPLTRAEILEKNFIERVMRGDYPAPVSDISPHDALLKKERFIDLFESQVMSRLLDIEARELRKTGESYYTIGSSGHEGNVVLGETFRSDDMAFLHYRSGALFIHRQKKRAGSTPLYDMLLSLVASSEDPIAAGRHKVFGSLPDLVPPQTSTIASHLPKAVGAALSINWSRDEHFAKVMRNDSVVLCNFGDASANHSTALGAINYATWWAYRGYAVPLVFVCEDNDIGISVPTPRDWIASTFSGRPGLKYVYANSLNMSEAYAAAEASVYYARTYRKPVFLHLKTIRLLGHAGSDVETLYHTLSDIEAVEAQDPLLHTARTIVHERWMTAEEVVNFYQQIKNRIRCIGREASVRPKYTHADQIQESLIPTNKKRTSPDPLSPELREEKLGALKLRQMDKPQHMAKLINWALYDLLLRYPEVHLFGEDVGKKGGVYHVTAGLQEELGDKRVFDTLLDEQSILGTALGMSQNGYLPIPEIQFLAYLHNAEDQIRGEAATLSFFSNMQFTNPMVVRIAGLAYQKGFGGHFHNDNSLAVLRDIPGLIIACPSNGRDAVLMLRECVRQAYEYGRVCVFIEPIALYMTKDLIQEGDLKWSFEYPSPEQSVAVGELGVIGQGEDLVIITYGNGTYLSCQAQEELAQQGIGVKIIDLRWLQPVNFEKLASLTADFSHILIVDECRHTGSQSEQLVTELYERGKGKDREIQRLTARDSFIPLGAGATCVLPGKEDIVAQVVAMLGKTGKVVARKTSKKKQAKR